ncbi:MAG: hypothetical protein IJB79_00165, partial [Candidatus Gastranaerophilales bacterium]|nr:hypothetical protein [Candidatus Gastranaerophilales bacterium]
GCEMSKSLLGIITVDINGEEEPNTPYKDQFNFPISSKGIEYEMMCQENELASYDCNSVAQLRNNYACMIESGQTPCNGGDITADYCSSLGSGWTFDPGGVCSNTRPDGSCGSGVVSCPSCHHPCGYSVSCCWPDLC